MIAGSAYLGLFRAGRIRKRSPPSPKGASQSTALGVSPGKLGPNANRSPGGATQVHKYRSSYSTSLRLSNDSSSSS